MREIVLDTETTGLDPKSGHRIVEIGCVELLNHMPSGNTYHQYINPERDMPEEAFGIHGLSEEFLGGFPVFSEIIEDFLAFVGDARLVIHNASFDMGFINAEIERANGPPLDMARAVDTVSMAREKFPGARVSLDALCQRFGIDNTNRALHGALLDARLLADVYLELTGGHQPDFVLGPGSQKIGPPTAQKTFREPRPHDPPAEDLVAHREFLSRLENPVWLVAAAES